MLWLAFRPYVCRVGALSDQHLPRAVPELHQASSPLRPLLLVARETYFHPREHAVASGDVDKRGLAAELAHHLADNSKPDAATSDPQREPSREALQNLIGENISVVSPP